MEETKYYLFKEPYKALILSYSTERALDEYSNNVATIDDGVEVTLVGKVRAVRLLSDSIGEDGEKTGLKKAIEQIDEMSEFLEISKDVCNGITVFVDADLM